MPGVSVWIDGATPPAPIRQEPQSAVETVPADDKPTTDSAEGKPQDSRVAPMPKKVKP